MIGQELKIVFRNDLAFLTEEVALDFNQVQIYHTPVKFQASAFWVIRVIGYIEKENRLFVEVISYQVGETSFSNIQLELADILISIEKVTFKSIDTSGLLRTLNGKVPLKIYPPKQEIVYRKEIETPIEVVTDREPIKWIYSDPFSIPIKEVTFHSGRISFEKRIQYFNKLIKFQIFSDHISEGYDAIKNYFASALKTKRIHVIPTITTVDGIISSISATSIEIEKIDKTLIKEIKFEFIKGIRKKESSSVKQLLTIDNYLEAYAVYGFNKKTFFKNDQEFFENVIENSGSRHYKQLSFLSSKHRSDILKLRIVHNPFSFVFLLSSDDRFHIVWETLDTQEATYIWSVVNDVNSLRHAIIRIEKTIFLIIRDGKNEYINLKEENFNRVFHYYTDIQNGFENWKLDFEKILV
jgi:hypothetical protein